MAEHITQGTTRVLLHKQYRMGRTPPPNPVAKASSEFASAGNYTQVVVNFEEPGPDGSRALKIEDTACHVLHRVSSPAEFDLEVELPNGKIFRFMSTRRPCAAIRSCVPFRRGFPLHRFPGCVVRVWGAPPHHPGFALVETVSSAEALARDKAQTTHVWYEGKMTTLVVPLALRDHDDEVIC